MRAHHVLLLPPLRAPPPGESAEGGIRFHSWADGADAPLSAGAPDAALLDARLGADPSCDSLPLLARVPPGTPLVLLVDDATPMQAVARAINGARVRLVLRNGLDVPGLSRFLEAWRSEQTARAAAQRELARAFAVHDEARRQHVASAGSDRPRPGLPAPRPRPDAEPHVL